MDPERTRTWLAFILVGGFALVACLTVSLVITGFLQTNDAIEILKAFSSVFSGFVGLVIGYYFGRAENSSNNAPLKVEPDA
ncbi:hypothetical protein [Shewanella salipaludis]|uniref:Uncharacterized protein n=1 Tax=Shewanella salipaludis TaxID=2723052 RepID=A0A972JH99_9GAMM|nr:hypothetical protein [Shewanella salipaludis]NMH63773.1 hypothetical protein [Shewanella salipaludis]